MYTGQEYIEESRQIFIKMTFTIPIRWNIITFVAKNEFGRIRCLSKDGIMIIQYMRKIPSKLFYDIKRSLIGIQYITGYFIGILPIINKKLYEQKYQRGYMLIRPITFRDVLCTDLRIRMHKAIRIPFYADYRNIIEKELSLPKIYVYLRDYIDSMTAFLNSDFDGSIRRLITSFENFHQFQRLKGKFRKKLNILCSKLKVDREGENKNRDSLESNIWILYQIRNRVVHDRLVIDFDCSWQEVSEKGIATLHYVYQQLEQDKDICDYIMKLNLEFTAIKGLNKFLDLDIIRYRSINEHIAPSCDNPEEVVNRLNDFIFEKIRISEYSQNHLGV